MVRKDGYPRLLEVPPRSFFLFGPRGVGKSFWLRRKLPGVLTFDLLHAATQLELTRDPSLLEARIGPRKEGTWIWVDEVQKVPALLDEVHRLMELKRWRFALSGSSARKLFRQGADLLAGRAVTRRMESLARPELGADFDLPQALAWGTLPLVVRDYVEVEKRTSTRKPTVICIEVKYAKKWKRGWEKALRDFAGSSRLKVERSLGLYVGEAAYHFDGVDVLPVPRFLDDLFAGKLF
ncbi:MAG: AAA family ATPase [Planctomycetes bacterium]|nr:AAA family ATPase [Planctomycetota bacterium]